MCHNMFYKIIWLSLNNIQIYGNVFLDIKQGYGLIGSEAVGSIWY